MVRTLVVIRHAKSDWSVPGPDRDRPLSRRGRRQAPAIGRWLAAQQILLDLAVVSPARRAWQTWEAVGTELGAAAPDARMEEAAYTFDGETLLTFVRGLAEDAETVAMVGHNPAVEVLVELLTGTHVPMPTAALAVVDLSTWTTAGSGRGRLRSAGRPADGRGFEAGRT